MQVPVMRDILSANARMAEENRRLLELHRICAVNVMASPGAGKTSLILRTIRALAEPVLRAGGPKERLRVGVIEGDIASRVDADKVAAAGAPVVQINTGGACHLDAPMVSSALQQLPLGEIDLLFIENVGNLICPVEFGLGEAARIVVSSIPEGDDKPYKYPGIFAAVDAIVLNKIDLAPYVPFDRPAFRKLVQGMNHEAAFFELSCATGAGLAAWIAWLQALAGRVRRQA